MIAKIMHTLLHFPLALTVFLAYTRVNAYTFAWHKAFALGATLSAVQLLIMFILKERPSFIVITTSLFLMLGSFSFFFHIMPLLELYRELKTSMFFLCFFIVSTANFIISIIHRRSISPLAWQLVWVTFLAFIVSYETRGSFIFSGILPMLGIKLAFHPGMRAFIQSKREKRK